MENTGDRCSQAAAIDYHGQSRRAGELHCDFFDFVPFPDGSLLFFLGDIAGYGHSAKMVAAGIGDLLRSSGGGELKSRVEEINRSVCDLSPNGLYVTLFCAFADPRRNQLTYVNAGHEPAILLSGRSRRLRRLENTGTVLGLTARLAYRQHTLRAEPGDLVAAFSDGVSEAVGPRGDEFREDGVLRIVRQHTEAPAAQLCATILEAAGQFAGSDPADDQTVAIVRFRDSAARNPQLRKDAAELAVAAA
ncbi:MAG TPA: PP2C family protein-serine/threonine phosphatase [Bryobacteraceae bacterium]|nr:PP2C family protein-serine/threonine phosphatase [Bryobacteraceae bacterium]